MVKRLNDTMAIAGSPPRSGENHSISVRAVDNGYVVSQCTFNPMTEEYKNSEAFYKECPRIMPAKVFRGSSPDMGEGGLRDTMQYLNNDK